MELATAALSSLLPKLGTLLSNEYKLQKGVRGEIKFLQVEMESMQAVLNMLSKLPSHQITDLDKIWVRDLKELSYDIEDSVNTFMVHIDTPLSDKPHSFKRFFDKTIGLLTKAKTRHHIANDIEDIKKRIQEVADRRERYNKLEGVAAQPDTSTTIDPRVLASFEHAANLVGTDVPVEKISDLLTKGKDDVHKQKRMVVSIVGVGGMGKTTIANLVYERLRSQFDCQAFVSVSLRPDMKQILRKILRQVSLPLPSARIFAECLPSGTNAGEMDPEELIRSIRRSLKDKRYFIVIDDVWSEEQWKTIQVALIDNNLGSRVIVTTRNVDVANLSSSINGSMCELDPLSYEDSKRLLSKRIFNEEEGILSELEEVTIKILVKCGGIPLAIITIASMLANIPNKEKWYNIYKSMGSGLEKHKSLGNMREILHLSYRDLPFHLKPCLLYLSMFPEDYEIQKYDLIRLWEVEGFVDGEHGGSLYSVGESYFNELVNRCMIQPVGEDIYGGALACRVHDMILDLIISLSAQENFVTISGGPNLINSVVKIRRLSLQGRDVISIGGDNVEEKVILPTMANMSHVRTLVAFGDASQLMPPLSNFTVLRGLDLKYFPNKNNNLKSLGSLHHLRYLKLRGDDVKTEHLEEIGNLKHLKTLDLSDICIEKLPVSILQLRQLKALFTRSTMKFPDGLQNLVSLLDLGDLFGEEESLMAELGHLTTLRVLTVYGLRASNDDCVKTFLRSLSNLYNLHTLCIHYLDFVKACSLDCIPDQWSGPLHLQRFHGHVSKMPRWFSSLFELSWLTMTGLEMLTQDDLLILGALPALQFLDLDVYDESTTVQWLEIRTDQPFRALTDFSFNTDNRKCRLVFAHGVMPKVQRLQLILHAREIESGGIDGVGRENLVSLKQFKVFVDCQGARITEVEAAETKCRDTIGKHPNHPTLEMSRYNNHRMNKDENEDVPEALEQERLSRLSLSSDLLATDHECNDGSEASEQSQA